MSDIIQVGQARVDITPPLSIPYLGYYPRQSYFMGVHDPLYARAVVFASAEERVALICADAIGFGNHILGEDRNFTQELRDRVQTMTGIRGENVMLAATHAHSTPETLGITRLLDVPAASYWLETLLDQLASSVAMAARELEDCRLKAGRGEVFGVGHNRRPWWGSLTLQEQVRQGHLDPELQLLVCAEEAGGAPCVLVNFQTHPVTVQVQPLVSADYPGVAAGLVERCVPGCKECLFLQGAAGNINPLRDDTRDFRDVTLYGTMVAGEAIKVAGRLLGPDVPPMREPVLRVARALVEIPGLPPFDRGEWEAKLAEAQERFERAQSEQERWQAGNDLRRAKEALYAIDRFSRPQRAEVQVLRIGEVAIVGLPAEVFCEWGLEIKGSSPAAYTFISELANGWVGYLLNRGGFAEGGYEASPGPWTQTSEQGGEMLTKTALELLQELWS
jgi:hypothetical protein